MTEPMRVAISDGRSLDVWLAGPPDATALLFHCGTPGSGLPRDAFVDLLAERGLRYVSFSRPGYGSSTRRPGRNVVDVVDVTATVLDAAGAERAYLLGWSGGGPHALACAAAMPDRVLGTAIIAGVAPYPANGLNWLDGMGAENIEEFNAALEGPEALIGFKERALPVYQAITGEQVADALGDLVDDVDRGSIRGELAEWMAAIMREGLREGYWGWYDDDMAFTRPWGFDLEGIRGPVHIWQGAHDRMVPFAHGEWLAGHCGGACRHLYAEHGHITLLTDAMPAILDELLRSAE